jgi:hypothetical protein
MRKRPFLVFFGLSLALFIVATLGFDLVARISVAQETLFHALSEHLHYAVMQPIGTVLLLVPFLILGQRRAGLSNFAEGRKMDSRCSRGRPVAFLKRTAAAGMSRRELSRPGQER